MLDSSRYLFVKCFTKMKTLTETIMKSQLVMWREIWWEEASLLSRFAATGITTRNCIVLPGLILFLFSGICRSLGFSSLHRMKRLSFVCRRRSRRRRVLQLIRRRFSFYSPSTLSKHWNTRSNERHLLPSGCKSGRGLANDLIVVSIRKARERRSFSVQLQWKSSWQSRE